MKYCLNCGAKLPENANFCPNCGFAVGKSEEEVKPTRAEMYKDRELDVSDVVDEEEPEQEKADPDETSSRVNSHKNNWWEMILSYLSGLGIWIKNNPLTTIVTLLLIILIYTFLSKMIAIVVAMLVLVCGYFYAKKVGVDSKVADSKIKAGFTKLKEALGKITQNSKKKEDKPIAPTDENGEVEDLRDHPAVHMDDPKKEDQNKNVIRKRPFKDNLLIFTAIILVVTSYIGPFASAVVAGYSTPTTLMSILKSLGNTSTLFGLLIGPALLMVGAFFQKRLLVKMGGIINILMYGYVFFNIYQNEARTSGMTNMFNNVKLGASGYLAVGISILILAFGVGSRKYRLNHKSENQSER